MEQTDSSPQNTSVRPLRSKLDWLTGCGCWAFFAGLCLAFFALFGIFASHEYGDFYFRPLAWSPDGQYLAFGEEKDVSPARRLFMVNSDGSNLRKLVDVHDLDPPDGWIREIRWSSDSKSVLFEYEYDTKTPRNIRKYHSIAVENGHVQPISDAEFSAANTVTNNQEMLLPATVCDEWRNIGERTAHPNGLIAQSACKSNSDDVYWGIVDCKQVLQVCDTKTTQLVFTFNDYELEGNQTAYFVEQFWSSVLILLAPILIVGGFVSFVIGIALHLLNQILKPEFRKNDRKIGHYWRGYD